MAGGIDKGAVVPVEATLLALAVVLTSLRLLLRLVLQRTRLTVSDWLLVASVLDAVALLVTDTMTYNLGGMDEYDPDAPPIPVADEIASMKIAFAGNYFYDTGIYLPKLALLAFYYRLIPPTMPKLRQFLHAVTGVTVIFAITTCFVDTFWCGSNVRVNWDPQGSCSSFTSMDITRIDWALNMTADLLIFSIPFYLLRGLRISRRYMIGLVATFSLGIITVAASIVRFATMQAIHAWTNVYVLSMVEMVAAIVVVCLPALKSLLRRGEPSTSKRGQSANTSRSKTYNTYGPGTSHIKLSSGRDMYAAGARATTIEESGSEVELHDMRRADAIYKTQRLSITSVRREDMD